MGRIVERHFVHFILIHLITTRYATQSAFTEAPLSSSTSNGISAADNNQQLRTLLVGGDFFLGTVLASTLTKLALRASVVQPSRV